MAQDVVNRNVVPSANSSADRKALVRQIVTGAFLGFAWGASLRAWMSLFALLQGDRPHYSWSGTFGGILLPVTLMGAILGGAVYAAKASQRKHWQWSLISPLMLVLIPALVLSDFIQSLVTTGLGGGTIFVALIGMIGGYALSGLGPRWLRWLAGAVSFLAIFATGIAFFALNGFPAVKFSANNAFLGLLFVTLMILLVAGVSAPFQYWRYRQSIEGN